MSAATLFGWRCVNKTCGWRCEDGSYAVVAKGCPNCKSDTKVWDFRPDWSGRFFLIFLLFVAENVILLQVWMHQ